jgi:hypothetical protein
VSGEAETQFVGSPSYHPRWPLYDVDPREFAQFGQAGHDGSGASVRSVVRARLAQEATINFDRAIAQLACRISANGDALQGHMCLVESIHAKQDIVQACFLQTSQQPTGNVWIGGPVAVGKDQNTGHLSRQRDRGT